jgi:mevalonyl-CoA ligase
LEQHPDVAQVAVVGIPDAYWGEIVGAFVKPSAGVSIAKSALKVWMRSRIAPHKVPDHFFFVGAGAGVPDEIPTNNTGKILKRDLRNVASSLLRVE